MTMESPASPFVDALELRRSVSDLFSVSPWRGLGKSLLFIGGVCLLTYLTLGSPTLWGFLSFGVLAGIWYAAFMITTHDAIHHTLTGWAWFDELLPRLMSYPVWWMHGLYAELHLLHHQMNGADVEDPERVTPTQEEYERSGPLGKWYYRNQILLETLVFGGFGMMYLTFKHALHHFPRNEAVRRQMLVDVAGMVGTNIVIYTLAIHAGIGWKYFFFYLIQERVVGFVMMLRTHVEHYGLWGKAANFFETQVLRSRNIKTSELVSLYFNRLNFHSAHHAFVEIPFYKLEEANCRILWLYESRGAKPARGKRYLAALWRHVREPLYIVNAHDPQSARVEPIPSPHKGWLGELQKTLAH